MMIHAPVIHHDISVLLLLSTGLVVGIAPVVAGAIVAGLMKGVGGLFGSHQKNAEQDAAYKQTMYRYNNWKESDQLRRNLVSGLAKAHGVESLLPPGYLEKFQNRTYTPPPQGYKQSALGAFAGAAVPEFMNHIVKAGNPEDATEDHSGGGGGGGGLFGSDGEFGQESVGASLGTNNSPLSSMGGLGSGNMGAPASPFKIKGLPSSWGKSGG